MAKRRKQKNKTAKYLISVTITVALFLMLYMAFVLSKEVFNPATIELSGPYDVVKVIDGDTVIVDLDGTDVHVRLIGVDTPESVAHEGYKENTKEGEDASAYTTNLLEGNTVYLEYDQELTDEYGRTLCYAYLHDKTTMVNELLLKQGYARTMTIEPNVKHEERFFSAEQHAKETGQGFWGTGFFY